MIFVGEGQRYHNAFFKVPLLTKRMIINSYETAKKKVLDNNKLNLAILEKYFAVESLTNIINGLLIDFISKQHSSSTAPTTERVFNETFAEHVSKKLDELIEKQVNQINERMEKIKNKEIKLAPIGKRLDKTGDSEAVKKSTRQDWYGAYFKEF